MSVVRLAEPSWSPTNSYCRNISIDGAFASKPLPMELGMFDDADEDRIKARKRYEGVASALQRRCHRKDGSHEHSMRTCYP